MVALKQILHVTLLNVLLQLVVLGERLATFLASERLHVFHANRQAQMLYIGLLLVSANFTSGGGLLRQFTHIHFGGGNKVILRWMLIPLVRLQISKILIGLFAVFHLANEGSGIGVFHLVL